MGYNTAVLILNDAIDMIAKDPKFGERLYEAVNTAYRGKQVDVPAHSYDADGNVRGIHCNAATVVESHHADGTTIVAFGQNCATKLDELYYITNGHHSEDGKLDIVRQLADNLGYRLVKKATRKKVGKKKVGAVKPHTCPYKEEINGDSTTLCTCDEAQTHECMMDI